MTKCIIKEQNEVRHKKYVLRKNVFMIPLNIEDDIRVDDSTKSYLNAQKKELIEMTS